MDAAAKKKIVDEYVAAYNSADLAKMLSLFAADATMEDPADAPPARGREAIEALYKMGFEQGIRLELEGSVRCTAHSVAFPMVARTAKATLSIIDVFDLNAEGKIQRMRAYWGMANLVGEMDLVPAS
jgi:steroid delta-isomerase